MAKPDPLDNLNPNPAEDGTPGVDKSNDNDKQNENNQTMDDSVTPSAADNSKKDSGPGQDFFDTYMKMLNDLQNFVEEKAEGDTNASSPSDTANPLEPPKPEPQAASEQDEKASSDNKESPSVSDAAEVVKDNPELLL